MQDDQRRYTDRELHDILQRALEIDGQERGAPGSLPGLSPREVESVAREAGISTGAIHRALTEHDDRRSGRLAGLLLGERLVFTYQMEVPRRLTDAEAKTVVDQVNATAGWQVSTSYAVRSPVETTITPGPEGATDVTIVDRLPAAAAGGIFGGIIGGLGLGGGLGVGLGVGMGALGSAAFAIAVPLGFLALSYTLARGIYRAVVRRRRSVMRRLLDQLHSLVGGTGG